MGRGGWVHAGLGLWLRRYPDGGCSIYQTADQARPGTTPYADILFELHLSAGAYHRLQGELVGALLTAASPATASPPPLEAPCSDPPSAADDVPSPSSVAS